MKKSLKITLIVIGGVLVTIVSNLVFVLLLMLGYFEKPDVITDKTKYEDVIGKDAKGEYQNKWDMSEEIFPSSIKNLNIKDFKMVYYNPWDAEYLAYLVVDYDDEAYLKEKERLNEIGIDDYKGIYGVTGFKNYELLAMNSDSYQGFVYAITKDNNEIIYVEMIFCNYFMDINYKKEIPNEYLPDNFDATLNNPYQKKMSKE